MLCIVTETIINNVKKKIIQWENIFKLCSERGIITKTCKAFKPDIKEASNPIKKWTKDLNRHFSKEDNKMARR